MLRGRLLLLEDDELTPMSGVMLRADLSDLHRQCTTDENGVFAFSDLPWMRGTIQILGTTCVSAVADPNMRWAWVCFEPTEILRDIVLMPGSQKPRDNVQGNRTGSAAGVIRGRVLDRDGQPLPGARVEASGTGRFSLTGTDGSFLLPDLYPGGHLLRVSCGDRAFPLLPRIEAGSPDFDVRELAGGVIAGEVRDDDGRLMCGAWVEVCPDPSPGEELDPREPNPFRPANSHRYLTDRDGQFRIGGLDDSVHIVQVRGITSSGAWSEPVRGIIPGRTGLQLHAWVTHSDSPSVIAGTVVDQDGEPREGVRVTADRSPLHGPTGTATTNEKGRFYLLGLGSGFHAVTAEKSGRTIREERVTVGSRELTMRLPR